MKSKYAYFFIAESNGLQETWLPDGGENSIVLQPIGSRIDDTIVNNKPSIYTMVKRMVSKNLQKVSYESSIKLVPVYSNNELAYGSGQLKNKFRGKPDLLQYEEYPYNTPNDWELLFQIDSTNIPFYLNFGGTGVGYGFINTKIEEAKFLWQC